MALVLIESEELAAMIRQAVEETVKTQAVSIPDPLPPLLTTAQFMDLLDISRPKAIELMARPGFPVTREFGNPRILTKSLFEWIEESMGLVVRNDGWNRRKAR